MEICQLVHEIQKFNTYTTLEELKHIQYIIIQSLTKIENNLFEDYCSFHDKKERQIYRNQTYIDNQLSILQNIYLQYQKKEETYKYPSKLTTLQNTINSYHEKIKENLQNISRGKLRKITILRNLVSLENQKIYIEKKILLQKLNVEWPLGNWVQNLLDIKNSNKIVRSKIKCFTELHHFFFKREQNNYFSQLHSILNEEISLLFKFKNLQHNTQEKIYKINPNNQIEIENLNLMLGIEKDIYQNSQHNLSKKLDSIVTNFKKVTIDFATKKQNLDLRVAECLNLYKLNISSKYTHFEREIKILQLWQNKQERNLEILNKLREVTLNLDIENQNFIEDNIKLELKILQLEDDKNRMIPGIIKKYHFYMNFYHKDINETKIRINVTQKKLSNIKAKKFDMLDKTKLTRQKINILKKLQININQKINEYQERN